MQSHYDEIQQLGATVYGVSADSLEENKALATKAKLSITLLSDANGNATDAFGLRHEGASIEGEDIARPAVFILDEEGKIVWRSVPNDYRIRVRSETVIERLQAIQ